MTGVDLREITVVCGHYGCGKTNLSVNMALDAAASGDDVTLVDLDIVNPYFRSGDYRRMLESKGVRVVSPSFAGTNTDTPSLPPSVRTALRGGGKVIVDSGGDDAGAVALGRFSDDIASRDYDMLYVVNMYRRSVGTPEEAASLLRSIEAACRLRATGVVNNSHLKDETDASVVEASMPYAELTALMLGLPLRFTAAARRAASGLPAKNVYPVDIYVKTPWEEGR
ncbi:MAG: hypothetical protein RBQ77_05500 [Candidatus Methanomethylophilaceae archaeon]|jgi:hypothetical protein|nr:hypothetical protein [Candidatus Methanomethylophilaceae archaeon]